MADSSPAIYSRGGCSRYEIVRISREICSTKPALSEAVLAAAGSSLGPTSGLFQYSWLNLRASVQRCRVIRDRSAFVLRPATVVGGPTVPADSRSQYAALPSAHGPFAPVLHGIFALLLRPTALWKVSVDSPLLADDETREGQKAQHPRILSFWIRELNRRGRKQKPVPGANDFQ